MESKEKCFNQNSGIPIRIQRRTEETGCVGIQDNFEKKEIIYPGTDRSRQDNGGRISGGESSRGRTGRKDLLSDGEDDHQNGGKSGIRDPEEAGSEDESHHIDGKRKDLFL